VDTRWVGEKMPQFTRFSESLNKKEDKRIVGVTVRPMMKDCTGELWITDMMLQEGNKVSGYLLNQEGMVERYSGDEAVVGKRFFNGVIRSSDTIIVLNLGKTSAGIDIQIFPKDSMKAKSVVVGTGTGAHKAIFEAAVKADDRLELLASSRECLKNDAATKKKGFFQYCAAGDSKQYVAVEEGKSARIYVEFEEMQEGSGLV